MSHPSQPIMDTVLDPIQIQELRQLDETGSLLTTLIDHFLKQTPEVVDSIHRALSGGDAQEVARVAHDLKGSSSNFGAKLMVSLCRDIQRSGEAGELGRVESALVQLRAAFQLVAQQLLIERERRITGAQ